MFEVMIVCVAKELVYSCYYGNTKYINKWYYFYSVFYKRSTQQMQVGCVGVSAWLSSLRKLCVCMFAHMVE